MNLLAVEILFAGLALKRGWRLAPLALVALPFAADAVAPVLAGLLVPWIGAFFDPASTLHAVAHAAALLGLAMACWARPSELPATSFRLIPSRKRAGPLYQI